MTSRALTLPTAEHTTMRRRGFWRWSAELEEQRFSLVITAVVFSGSTYIARSRLVLTFHVKLGAENRSEIHTFMCNISLWVFIETNTILMVYKE